MNDYLCFIILIGKGVSQNLSYIPICTLFRLFCVQRLYHNMLLKDRFISPVISISNYQQSIQWVAYHGYRTVSRVKLHSLTKPIVSPHKLTRNIQHESRCGTSRPGLETELWFSGHRPRRRPSIDASSTGLTTAPAGYSLETETNWNCFIGTITEQAWLCEWNFAQTRWPG